MKVWKSPVLYIGLLLVVAVFGALFAPYVIDWNGYRADLEAYGRKITGREVRVNGNVTARLFPWPRLTMENVSIANLPGLETKDFATAERIDVRIALAGLFSGTLQAETVAIDNPVVAMELNAAGLGNWQFEPVLDPAGSDLLGRVKLDRITLEGGTLMLTHRRLGRTLRLDNFAAVLSAPEVRGPWRMRSTAVHENRTLDIGLNTASWKADEPFRFGLRVANADNSGLAYSFDGSNTGNQFEGTVRVEPVAKLQEKTDTEGEFRPLVLTAQLLATFDDIRFDDIQIAPVDVNDGGTMMTGSARLSLGAALKASADLQSPHIDLDVLAGAKTRQLLRDGEGFVLASQLLGLIPNGLALEGAVKISSLTAGGENLENVALELAADQEGITVRRFRASLPGRSAVIVEGRYYPGGEGGEFSGKLDAESGDLRLLASWLWPEGKTDIEQLWTGERGRAELITEVSLRPSRLRFEKADFTLDGVRGSGNLVVGLGEQKSIELRIASDLLDIDRYAKPTATPTIFNIWPLLLNSKLSSRLRLVVEAGALALNGVEAQDVALDLESSPVGLQLRLLQIGSVEGARLDAEGVVTEGQAGTSGNIGLKIVADDPRGLLRLVGVLHGESVPPWAAALGATAIESDLKVRQDGGATVVDVDVNGTTGVLTVSVTGTISGGDDFSIRGSGSIKAPNGAELGKLAGFSAVGADTSPAYLEVTVAGSLDKGFDASAKIEAFGAGAEYTGRAGPGGVLDGKVGVLAVSAVPLAAAFGLPPSPGLSDRLSFEGVVKRQENLPGVLTFNGKLGAAAFDGNATLDQEGKLAAGIAVGSLSVSQIVAAALLDWNGRQASPETNFAAGLPFGLEGELWITPRELRISEIYTSRSAQAAIKSIGGDIDVEIFGKDENGVTASITIASKPDGEEGRRSVAGKIVLPIDLARQLRLDSGEVAANGTGVIEVAFNGNGRSPGGALTGLNGSGNFRIDGLEVARIDVPAFKRAAAAATSSEGLTAAFDALRAGGALALGDVKGIITIVNGVAAFSPVKSATADAEAELRSVAELGIGTIDSAIMLSIRDSVPRPAMEISFAGSPDALARRDDGAELFGNLGVAMMNAGVAELERLREEQERLAAEEELARKEDEIKLQDHYAQRDELRLRQRELRVHAALRAQAADALRAEIEQSRAANTEINKSELRQRLRELRARRTIRRQAQVALVPPPKPKPKIEQPVLAIEPEPPLQVPPSQTDSSPSQ